MVIPGLGAIRRGEHRNVWAAFFLLFGLIGSHMVLETARDALFLASLPASRLPIVYIGIALLSLLITQLQLRLAKSLNRRRALSIWTGLAAGVTLGFWLFLQDLGDAGFFALYIWSGVLTTLVLIHFWVLLSNIFTVTQAKRLYAFIGTGSVMGAIVGSAFAGTLAPLVGAQNLLLVSAIGFLATSMVPFFLEDIGVSTIEGKAAEANQRFGAAVRYIFAHPYTRSVVVLILVTTASVTLADYIFKATVAEHVAAEDLGGFFAWVYFATNLASLFVQLWLVNFLLKRFDIAVALSVLPALLVIGGLGMLLLPGLVAVLVIKGADGTLRHSLMRTANELLFLPLTDQVRARVKAFIDIVGQRGGQAMVSLIILTLGFAGAGLAVMAGLLVLLGVAWLACVIVVRRHYLDLFRSRLQRDDEFSEFPELDLASLETLISLLDSQNVDEVIAAINVLEIEDKARLVPGFILYHPSERVVERALSLFVRNHRDNVVPIVRQLLDRRSEPVRAAAIAAISVLAFDERELRSMLSQEESAAVRATIMVNLIASGAIAGSDAQQALEAIVANGRPEEKIALIQSIARRGATGFDDAIERLAADPNARVQLTVARAVGHLQRPSLLPVLLQLLVSGHTRAIARADLVRFGDQGRDFLLRMLADSDVHLLARWQIPATLVMFDDAGTLAPMLLQRMSEERDGMLRFRIIRALEDMLDDAPQVELDRELLQGAMSRTVSQAYRYLDRRMALHRGSTEDPACATAVYGLLDAALREKERNAIDRVLRLLGLMHRHEDFDRIREGLSSDDPDTRIGAIELIENVVEPPLRGAIVGLCEKADDAIRMAQAGPYHVEQGLDYQALLLQLINESSSVAIRALAIHHAGELGLTGLRAALQALITRCRDDVGAQMLCGDAELALQRLQGGGDLASGSTGSSSTGQEARE